MFNKLLSRYVVAPIDDDRVHGLIVENVVGSAPLAVSGLSLSGVKAAAVALVDSSGNQISAFTGGTQYTDGGVPPAHPTAPSLSWNDGAHWQTVSTTQPLPVSGTFSLSNYALETGGNLATMVTSLGTIDTDLKANIVLKAGTNVIGKVSQDTSPWVVGGTAATNGTLVGNPINLGAQAVTSENSALTTAKQAQLVADKVGKLITLPYANPENFVRGVNSATGTSETEVIAAQASGMFIYITSISIVNTGATASLVTIITDTASAKTAIWYMINPATGGDNITFPTPLKVPVSNKNVGFVCGSSSTTQYCSISGYFGV